VIELTKLIAISMDGIEKLESEKDKAIAWAVYGLACNEDHHKQWFLEKVVEALGVDIEELRAEAHRLGMLWWEAGIAP